MEPAANLTFGFPPRVGVCSGQTDRKATSQTKSYYRTMPTLERHPESWRLDSLEREMKRVEESLERRIERTNDRLEELDRRSRKSENWIFFFPLRVIEVAIYLLLIGFVVFDVIVAAHH